jgi:hypothetical protein
VTGRSRRPRKSWAELSAGQRSAVLSLVVLQAILAAIAQRDLSDRAESELRGSKRLWRVLTLNTVGAVAYLIVGRRPAR